MAQLIVSAGYMPLDIVRYDGIPYARRAGGTAGNVAAILSYLGWKSSVIGHVGPDAAGHELISDFNTAGVDTALLERAQGVQTNRLVHNVEATGHSFAFRCPACGSKLPRSRQLSLKLATSALAAYPEPDVFFFDRINSGTLLLAEAYAKRATVVVFEPSMPASADSLARAMAAADIMKFSDERADVSMSMAKPRQLLIVTHGAGGLTATFEDSSSRFYPGIPTDVVDTAGAGDWTTAGILTTIVRDKHVDFLRLDDAVRLGQTLAAMCCNFVGARGLMSCRRSDVLTRAEAIVPSIDFGLRQAGVQRSLLRDVVGYCSECLMAESASNGPNALRPNVIG